MAFVWVLLDSSPAPQVENLGLSKTLMAIGPTGHHLSLVTRMTSEKCFLGIAEDQMTPWPGRQGIMGDLRDWLRYLHRYVRTLNINSPLSARQ